MAAINIYSVYVTGKELKEQINRWKKGTPPSDELVGMVNKICKGVWLKYDRDRTAEDLMSDVWMKVMQRPWEKRRNPGWNDIEKICDGSVWIIHNRITESTARRQQVNYFSYITTIAVNEARRAARKRKTELRQ